MCMVNQNHYQTKEKQLKSIENTRCLLNKSNHCKDEAIQRKYQFLFQYFSECDYSYNFGNFTICMSDIGTFLFKFGRGILKDCYCNTWNNKFSQTIVINLPSIHSNNNRKNIILIPVDIEQLILQISISYEEKSLIHINKQEKKKFYSVILEKKKFYSVILDMNNLKIIRNERFEEE